MCEVVEACEARAIRKYLLLLHFLMQSKVYRIRGAIDLAKIPRFGVFQDTAGETYSNLWY